MDNTISTAAEAGLKLILEIHVTFDQSQITHLACGDEQVLFIPFGGTVTGDIFTGRVCPGAADVQRVNLSGVRHMCARYMLEGTDSSGNACRIYVENNGWFDGEAAMPFKTVPTFVTDSEALAPYLHCRKFVGRGYPAPNGVNIRLYEVVG